MKDYHGMLFMSKDMSETHIAINKDSIMYSCYCIESMRWSQISLENLEYMIEVNWWIPLS